jgi:hypothetical protein
MQKELPCESDHCTVVTVLRATSVIITSTDANGYEHQQGGPVQRLTISIDAQTYHPESYDGGVGLGVGEIGTLDLICWHNCFDLETGSRHFMGHGHVFYVTNEATMYHMCRSGEPNGKFSNSVAVWIPTTVRLFLHWTNGCAEPQQFY